MAVYKILHYPHVLLRKKSSIVHKFTPDLSIFVENMMQTMWAFEGIGLAAPQVGILKRIFVIDIRPYLQNSELKDWHGKFEVTIDGNAGALDTPLCLINPVLVEASEKIIFPFDGCLSFPGVESKNTERFKAIVLEARTPDNKSLLIRADGILSICIQHELDHLDGVLFIDHAQAKPADKEIRKDIEEFESSTEEHRRIKKMKPLDARKEKFAFL